MAVLIGTTVNIQVIPAAPGTVSSEPLAPLPIASLQRVVSASVDTATPDGLDKHLNHQIDQYRDELTAGKPNTALTLLKKLLGTLPGSATQQVIFRIKANIGLCLMTLGRDDVAAGWLLEAYYHTPESSKAISNKTLAHLLRSENEIAISYAREQLARDPDNEVLASYMIQGASQIPAIEDPMTNIPAGLRERPEVMLAEIAFYRNRNEEEIWIAKARSARQRHPDATKITLFAAEADIADVCRAGDYLVTHRSSAEVTERLAAAAAKLESEWQRCRASEHASSDEAMSIASSAMIGWHLARDPERACAVAEEVVAAGVTHVPTIINAAQILAENGRIEMAKKAFALAPGTPQARWVKGLGFIEQGDWTGAASVFAGGDIPDSEKSLARMFSALAPLRDQSAPTLELAFPKLLADAKDDARSLTVLARFARERGLMELADAAFQTVLGLITPTTNMAARLMVASYAVGSGNSTAVIDLLDAVIPRERDSQDLEWLADAHASENPKRQRNKAFFESLPESLQAQLSYARAHAAVLLAIGGHDDEAIALLRDVREAHPEDTYSAIQLAEAYEKKRDNAAFQELAANINPSMMHCSSIHRMAIAHILREGGRPEVALSEGYRAVRDAPKDPQVALGYVGLILGDRSELIIPTIDGIGPDTFVRITGPHRQEQAFIIDSGEGFWGLDTLSPNHDLVVRLAGKHIGDTIQFAKAAGKDETWTVAEVKNKYLHVLHVAMGDFERRFEGYDGLYKVTTDGEDIGPILDTIRVTAKSSRENARHYTDRHLPLEFVARMLGGDVLSFADYIRSLGLGIYTCNGNAPERDQAITTALNWQGRGAVLDTYTASVAAELDILPALKAHFGTLYVSRASLDLIERRTNKEHANLGQNSMTIGWHAGEFYRHIAKDDEVRGNIADLELMKARIEASAVIEPVLLPDDISDDTASLLEKIGAGALHPIYQAAGHKAVLLSDDAIYRSLGRHTTGVESLWLQPSLVAAMRAPHITMEGYTKAVVGLAVRRHDHVGVTSADLLQTYAADADGSLVEFTALASRLGGASADLLSHSNVVLRVLLALWAEQTPDPLKRAKATGMLLENVIRGRSNDYAECIGYIGAATERNAELVAYLSDWIRGHFLPMEAIAQSFHYWSDRFKEQKRLRLRCMLPARNLYS